MSLGAKALACPGAEARPPGLGGEQLKPVWMQLTSLKKKNKV